MVLSEPQRKAFIRRLLLARMRILCSHGFYGLLLMHMTFSLNEACKTAATDGKTITFSPDFLSGLSDRELDFVLMHEILHAALRHCLRQKEREHERFNIACDIVVNSNILLENGMDEASITLKDHGVSMHLAPDGKEGHLYTAEQVYEMLPKGGSGGQFAARWDDHGAWAQSEEDGELADLWIKRFDDACTSVMLRDPDDSRGLLPRFAKRIWSDLRAPRTDWRNILAEFVQQEVCDYSFCPPDRRFSDSGFFLPDLNALGPGGHPADILFMIDTSASVSDREMTAAFSEVKGAVEQFDGALKGWLGFFDAGVVPPIPFETVEELLEIRPAGGGGTSFHAVLRYVREKMTDEPPACIVILTDGFAPFPKEQAAMGIPVLWLLTTKTVTPPWGKTAYIEVE